MNLRADRRLGYSYQLASPSNKSRVVVTSEEFQYIKASIADCWGLLIHIGVSDPDLGNDPAVLFLKALAGEFVSRIRLTGQLPEFSQVEKTIENSLAEMGETFDFDCSFSERAWNEMIKRMEQVHQDTNLSYQKILQSFTFYFAAEGSLQIHLEDSKNSQYPFLMRVGYLVKKKDLLIERPLSDLLNPKAGTKKITQTALMNLDSLIKKSSWFQDLIFDGSILNPVPVGSAQAMQLLEIANKKQTGDIVFNLPKWVQNKKSGIFNLEAHLGLEDTSLFSADSLISLKPSLVINGERVSEEELARMADQEDGLKYLNGRWVMVEQGQLQSFLRQMKKIKKDNLSFFEALRLEAGLNEKLSAKVSMDQWLMQRLSSLRNPRIDQNLEIPQDVKGHLFAYQKNGYAWLNMMRQVNLGACLADDMGLGKTLQVLTLLDHLKSEKPQAKSLIIVPASLLVNWKKEAQKFTPGLKVQILHGQSVEQMQQDLHQSDAQVIITTYGMSRKMEFLKKEKWEYLILDEAQAIKNPRSKQTVAIKKIPAAHKIALTGTPIENDLSNLWSIFDFLNKGLLGSYEQFRQTIKTMKAEDPEYKKLHHLIQPFLLRRMKNDKSIISDLPDKIEKSEYVPLSKKQTALYLKEIKTLQAILSDRSIDRITRSGRILAAMTHFKQICNHPDQYTGKPEYKSADSGKFEVLKDICATIKENHESVLVFTQYREIIPHLQKHLTECFGAEGLVIHGSTPVKKRQEIVDAFNEQKTYIPFMILSLKAGGTGLNLTQASHVIHFDRWWNPAVENQATDRAYRIGQNKNVVVHKFITEGTIEEHIDELIESKKQLAENVIGSGADKWITEMNDADLLDLVRLT